MERLSTQSMETDIYIYIFFFFYQNNFGPLQHS